jgi:hypothetical protein
MPSPTEIRLIRALELDMSAMAAAALELEKLGRVGPAHDLFERIRENADLIREIRP